MKKKLIIVSFAIIVAGIITSIACHSAELLKNDVEALSECEITKKDGTVVFVCTGEKERCEDAYFGFTLNCSGKRVELE